MLNRLLAALLALALSAPLPAFANDLSNSSWSETDSSNNSASPNGWTSGSMLPSQVEPTARAMMGAIKRWYDHANGVKTSAGTNTATLTYDVAPAAYVTGDFYLFKAGGTNTGATTLNVNALGAKAVQAAGAALTVGEITSGFYYGVVYDGTQFQIVFTNDALGAWTAYTPSVTCASGTLTTSSTGGRYKVRGKSVEVTITLTITTNGTCAGYWNLDLPKTAGAGVYHLTGGVDATGLAGHCTIAAAGTATSCLKYDGSYMATAGTVVFTGVYERN